MPSSGVQTCALDRKSTRLNSSHTIISYAVFCLKKQTPYALASTPTRRRARHTRSAARARAARAPPRVGGRALGGGVGDLLRLFFFLSMPAEPKLPPFPGRSPLAI